MKKFFITFIACILSCAYAHSMILYGEGNDGTTSAPDNGLPWTSVVAVGSSGTAIYLGNGYFLTANHVYVTDITLHDGTKHLLDESYGEEGYFKIGNEDLKIFRVENEAALNIEAAELYNGLVDDGTLAYFVGHGVGRDATPIDTANETIHATGAHAMRWGTNEVFTSELGNDVFVYASYANAPTSESDPFDYTYEAALTNGDSGGPMFVQIMGRWYVAGIANSVFPSATSAIFSSNDEDAHINFVLRSIDFYDEIQSILAIPEPSTMALTSGALMLAFAFFKRRK